MSGLLLNLLVISWRLFMSSMSRLISRCLIMSNGMVQPVSRATIAPTVKERMTIFHRLNTPFI